MSSAEEMASAFEQDGGKDLSVGSGKRTKSDRVEHKHASQPGGDTRKVVQTAVNGEAKRKEKYMTSNGSMINYELDEESFIENFLEDRNALASDEKFLEEQKTLLECSETLNDDDPTPERSLNFEEAWKKDQQYTYESQYKNIVFLKEDVGIVNSMSHCSPDDIAKLIRSIHNSVYSLGMEEARQCRRGKVLAVLKNEETDDVAGTVSSTGDQT